jgi:hypothetical protein
MPQTPTSLPVAAVLPRLIRQLRKVVVHRRLRCLGLAPHLSVSLHVAVVDELRLADSGIENVVVEGLVGVVGAEAAGGDKTRVALERREEHLCDARWAGGTRTQVSPQDTLCQSL